MQELQLQREWESHLEDLNRLEHPAMNDHPGNGQLVMDYWVSRRHGWPLLVQIAIEALKAVISSAEVERYFSVWSYHMGKLDAFCLSVENQVARGFVTQNRVHIEAAKKAQAAALDAAQGDERKEDGDGDSDDMPILPRRVHCAVNDDDDDNLPPRVQYDDDVLMDANAACDALFNDD